MMHDPDNMGYQPGKKKPPGPKAYHAYKPNMALRVNWGEWGPEHITVPGNACGLDIDNRFGTPKDGRILQPHNIDTWGQKQLFLITFCWFAETLTLNWESK